MIAVELGGELNVQVCNGKREAQIEEQGRRLGSMSTRMVESTKQEEEEREG